MQNIEKMKNIYSLILIFTVGVLINACVDDYQDANPPRLLDAPAVASVTAANEFIQDGESTTITISVVDCPAGIDSIAYQLADENGDPIGKLTIDNFNEVKGKNKAEIVATYTSVPSVAVEVTLTFTVYDLQYREGEEVRKSSVPQSVTITVVCASDLAGIYNAITNGTSTDGGANNNPAVDIESVVTLTATETPGEYIIDKATGKVFDAWYLGVYYGDPIDVEGVLKDACGSITLDSYDSPFGDPITESSGSVDGNGVITFTAVNAYGDEWTVVLTPQQ